MTNEAAERERVLRSLTFEPAQYHVIQLTLCHIL